MKRIIFTFLVVALALISFAEERNEPAEILYRKAYAIEIGNDSIPGDIKKAIPLYIRSAEAGYAPAQSYLGYCYYNGNGIERQPHLGVDWIEKAAMQGDIKACNNLGWLLANGEEFVRDYSKAAYWFGKAADAGLPMAQSQLADLYKEGRGVETDTLVARNLYIKAIAGGLADAERKLLAMDYNRYLTLSADSATIKGVDFYKRRAYSISATLFEMAVEKGSALAKFWLAESYTHGRGVEYDFDKALDWYYQAACEGIASAQYIVAETLEMFPDAIPQDSHGPKYWLEKANQSGIFSAEDAYSVMFDKQ